MKAEQMPKEKILEEAGAIVKERWTDGIALSCGTSSIAEELCLGNYVNGTSIQEVGVHTLFDLASVSKIFALFTIASLQSEGLIDINKQIKEYSSLYVFKNLQELYLYELLNFSKQIETSVRIERCNTDAEVSDVICNASIKSSDAKYNDIGAVVISYIIDTLYGKDFFRNYSKKMWSYIGLTDTFWFDEIPTDRFNNIQSYDNEYRLSSEGTLYSVHTPLGIAHDMKSRRIGASGHAGIFSSVADISKFCTAMLSYRIVDKSFIDSFITTDRYDTFVSDNNQHFGLLCYKKTMDSHTSELPQTASDHSIAISGYTGCYLCLDFQTNAYVFIGSNRIRERLTAIEPTEPYAESCPYIKATKDYVYRKDSLRDLLYLRATSM